MPHWPGIPTRWLRGHLVNLGGVHWYQEFPNHINGNVQYQGGDGAFVALLQHCTLLRAFPTVFDPPPPDPRDKSVVSKAQPTSSLVYRGLSHQYSRVTSPFVDFALQVESLRLQGREPDIFR